LDTATVKERISGDEQDGRTVGGDRRKGCIDLAASAGADDLELQPHGGGSRFGVPQGRLGNRDIGWIDEDCEPCRRRHQFAQQLQLLSCQLAIEKIDAC
jgi:hypothetical protein